MLSDQPQQIGVHQIEVVTAESRNGHWTPSQAGRHSILELLSLCHEIWWCFSVMDTVHEQTVFVGNLILQ